MWLLHILICTPGKYLPDHSQGQPNTKQTRSGEGAEQGSSAPQLSARAPPQQHPSLWPSLSSFHCGPGPTWSHGAVPSKWQLVFHPSCVWANIPSDTYMVNSGWQGNACVEGIFAVLLSYCALAPVESGWLLREAHQENLLSSPCLPCCRDNSFQAATQSFQNNTTIFPLAICPWIQIKVLSEKIILCHFFIIIHSTLPLLSQRQHDRSDFSYVSYSFKTKNTLSVSRQKKGLILKLTV